MPGIRTLEIGYADSVKTYAKPETAQAKAAEWAGRIKGLVNVRIAPAVDASGQIRYTAIFSCFSEESDIFLLARNRCPFLLHR